jgi:hypothetical protein
MRTIPLSQPIALTAGILFVCVALVAGSSQSALTEGGGKVVRPTDFETDVSISEDVLAVVLGRLRQTFLAGVRTFDWSLAAEGLSDQFLGTFPEPLQGSIVDDDGLLIRQYGSSDLQWFGQREFLSVISRHTESWTSVERSYLKVTEFFLEPTFDRAFLKGHLQLGGSDSTGTRSVLDSTISVTAALGPSGQWQLERFDFLEGIAVKSSLPPFRDITDAVGFHFNRSEENNELRRDIVDTRSSLIDSGLSVVDWNHDGFWDVIATESMNQAVLFINNGKGGFTRGVLPFDDPRLIPSQVLFVDLDGDGLEELVGNRVLYRDGRGSIGLYTRKAGKWLFLPNAFEFNNLLDTRRSDAQPMTVGDVNGDGLLDVVIAGYENDQSKDPRTFNRVDARDGAETLLFINHGELRFEEESDARGIFGTRYTYVVGLFDFNADGDLDLFEGNDYGSNVLWDNQGDGTFRELNEHPLAGDSSNTMGLTIGDWDNSGRWSVYLSNMYSHAGQRVVNLAQSLGKEMQARLGLLAKGNQLFTQESTGKPWVETAVERKINAAGWAWASLFVDLDNDGDKEIFVTNGNTSHRDSEAPDY